MKLSEVLLEEAKRTEIVEDVSRLVDDEVSKQKGLGGVAVRTGYKLVQGVKPGFVRNVVQNLLPEFAAALERYAEKAARENRPVSEYFQDHSTEIAEALLAVTDGRASGSKHGSVKGAYVKLRGSARKNVEAAVPGLGRIVEKHL